MGVEGWVYSKDVRGEPILCNECMRGWSNSEQVRKNKKITITAAVGLLALLFAACIFFRVRRPGDVTQHSVMASEFPEIWRALARRHFGPGDSAEELIKQCPPRKTKKFGAYAMYEYYAGGLQMSGISVIAREGKLISARAGGCGLNYTFFETVDPEWEKQYEVYAREKWKRLELRGLSTLSTNLVVFHQKFERWPTNEKEFATFVTGMKNTGTNLFRIALESQDDGSIEVVKLEFPDEKRRVALPDQKN